jgi:single-stranded-DNA-specific exonuclease
LSPIREYRWTFRTETNVTPEMRQIALSLAQELSISPILTEILVSRGIDTFEKARTFFRPSMEDLHDPFIMHDMDAAVKRISLAILKNEHMVVFGDYDVDGTDSTAMLWKFLKDAGANVSYFIPDRIKDGYGISKAGIDHVHDRRLRFSLQLIAVLQQFCKWNMLAHTASMSSFAITMNRETKFQMLLPCSTH